MKTLFFFLIISCSLSAQQKYFTIDKNFQGGYNFYNNAGELVYGYTKHNTDSVTLETLRNIYLKSDSIKNKITKVEITNFPKQESNNQWWIILLTALIMIFTYVYSYVSYLSYRATKPVLKNNGIKVTGEEGHFIIINCAPHNIAVNSVYTRKRYKFRKPYKSPNMFFNLPGLRKQQLWVLYDRSTPKTNDMHYMFNIKWVENERFIDVDFHENELNDWRTLYVKTSSGVCKLPLPRVINKKYWVEDKRTGDENIIEIESDKNNSIEIKS